MDRFGRVAGLVFAIGMLVVQTAIDAQTPAPGFVDEAITSGLTSPTGFASLPDGRILIAQKSGIVRLFKNGVLQATPFIDLRTRVNDYWDRGLLGIAADPNFATNGFVYVYYVYEHNAADYGGPKTVRLTRVTAVGDAASLASEAVILGTLSGPSCGGFSAGSDCIPADSPAHNGGTIRFASDGTMYLSTGDASSFNVVDPLALRAQNLDSLAGKILHVTATGAGLSTNPFYNGSTSAARSKVWAYGLRNPFRFSLKPGTNMPYVGDVGWALWEEINLARRGANLGWPCYEGAHQQPNYGSLSQCQTLFGQGTGAVEMPLLEWAHNGIGAAVIGGAFYTGSSFPSAYQSAYFFGDYGRGTFSYLRTDPNDVVTSGPTAFESGVPGPVDLQMGVDGHLYYLAINTGELRRIRYAGASGGTSYLSSLPWTSATNGWGPVERDESNGEQAAGDGATLTLNGQTYARGLGMHAPSEVRFQLDGQCTAFQSFVGVDDEVGASGSVIFQVWADGVKLYDSGVMTGATATRTATANLTGRQELALIATNGGDNSNFDHADWADATITCNTGSGGVQLASAVAFPAGTNTHGVTSADLNNDGRLDLIAASSGSNLVSRWLGNGDGTFGARLDFATGLAPKSVSVADLNADGRADLVSSNQDASTVSVLLGNGAGGFAAAVHYPAAPNSHENAIADFNGDNRPDLIVVGWGGPVASILLGTGTGTFGARTNFTVGARPHSVVARDFNGDGRMDAAVANIDSNTVSVLIGRGDGTFNPHVQYAVGSGPHSIRSADIDGDGRWDVASANQASNTVSVLRGRVDGTFDPAVHHPMGNFPKGVNLGDIDGDGRVDLLSANTAGNYPVCCNPGGDTITIRRGLGNGSFAAAETFTVGLTPFAVTPADVDADGDLDILTANWHSNGISLLINLAGGPPTSPPVITGVSSTNITTATATITWTTDVPADTQVEYGLTTAYGTLTPLQSTLTTAHQVGLTGLTAGTQYHYRVRSRDADGELAISSNYSFTTATGGGGTVQYLSDLTWTSMTNAWGPAERDRSNGEQGATDGNPIRVAGVTYAKGLGVHAASEIRYAIPAGCTQFAANIGIDDEVGSGGSAVFRVLGGTTQLYQSATLTGTSATVGVTAGLSGHSELRLIVADGGNGVDFDHGDWANARFLCGTPSGPPVISSVGATNIATATATINWTTDVPADTQVEYGPTTAYGTSTPLQSTMVTSHQVGLTGLTAGTLYHYRVRSRDADGELSISGDFTFTTAQTSNTPPVPTMTLPASTLTYKVGDVINYAGSATDSEDGNLTASGLGWSVIIHHCPGGVCHNHPFTTATGTGGSFKIPDHGDESHFEVVLTATDSQGATANASVRIYPRTVQVTLNTSPAGLTVVYGGVSGTAPMTRTSIIGSMQTISVPSPQNGLPFSSWSDGGAQQHNITVGETNATYTATFSDGVGPIITNLSSSTTGTTATISWTTNEPASRQVEYGLTSAYGSVTPESSDRTLSHTVVISGLQPGTRYSYRVRSKDAGGNVTVATGTFRTRPR